MKRSVDKSCCRRYDNRGHPPPRPPTICLSPIPKPPQLTTRALPHDAPHILPLNPVVVARIRAPPNIYLSPRATARTGGAEPLPMSKNSTAQAWPRGPILRRILPACLTVVVCCQKKPTSTDLIPSRTFGHPLNIRDPRKKSLEAMTPTDRQDFCHLRPRCTSMSAAAFALRPHRPAQSPPAHVSTALSKGFLRKKN